MVRRCGPGPCRVDRLTRDALRAGLLASGATEEEAARFAVALQDRIGQIGAACGYAVEEPQRTIQAG